MDTGRFPEKFRAERKFPSPLPKKGLFDLDRALHQLLLKDGIRSDPDQLFARIVGADPPEADEMIIEKSAKFSDGVWSPERIVRDPRRFKATHVISHLVWKIRAKGSCFSSFMISTRT